MASRKAAPRARPQRPPPPPPPAFAGALVKVPQRAPLDAANDALWELEQAFGWEFPVPARRLLLATQAFELAAGCARVLPLDELRKINGLTKDPIDAVTWTCRRLGLFAFAADDAGNRFVVDVADVSGNAPVYWVSARLGLAGSATPVFPHAYDCIHAFALFAAGKEALDAQRDVERLTRELAEVRKHRPAPNFGRSEALAKLEAAFGGARSTETSTASAEDESRMASELEAAKEKSRQLWMPFMEQFARWHLYWRLLWNGPNSLGMAMESLDVPLIQAWRAAFPLGNAIISGRLDAVTTELQGRTAVPHPRALVAVAEAKALVGDVQGADAAVAAWEGPKPAMLARVVRSKSSTTTVQRQDLQWEKALGRSKKDTERFLSAISAQFCSDLKKHGTTNILGATKASVREGPDGKVVVEAGLNNVPLEVRKPLFEGKPVTLSGQFLKALTRELSRRLHEPKVKVDKTLTRLRNIVEEHINAHVNLTVPHVGTFRIKNEPAATGVSRFYLILDVAPELLAAAQEATVHRVSADFHADVPYE